MISSIKAELRKIFSIRSTYIMLALAVALMLLYNFYIVGWRATTGHHDIVSLKDHLYMVKQVTTDAEIGAPFLFSSIIAILLLGHEYRYNTIMYTLTASNSRNKTMAAKILAITGFVIIFSLIAAALAPALTLAGLHAHHLTLASQTFYYKQYIGRVLFYGWAYAMIALLLASYFRNVVASIVALFFIPVTVESLLGLLLNNNQQQYLPFRALSSVLDNGLSNRGPNLLSAERSALVVLIYLVIGWAISWMIFLRRDAN